MKEVMWFDCTGKGIQKVAYSVIHETCDKICLEKKDGTSVSFTIHKLDIGKVKFAEMGTHASVFLWEDDEEMAKRLVSEQITMEQVKLTAVILNYKGIIKGIGRDFESMFGTGRMVEHIDRSSMYLSNVATLRTFGVPETVTGKEE